MGFCEMLLLGDFLDGADVFMFRKLTIKVRWEWTLRVVGVLAADALLAYLVLHV